MNSAHVTVTLILSLLSLSSVHYQVKERQNGFCFGLLIILALRHPPVNYIPDFSLFSLYRVDFEKKVYSE